MQTWGSSCGSAASWRRPVLDGIAKYLMEKLPRVPGDFWSVLGEMSPYLLFGFFVAGLLSILISQKAVERHLGGKGIWPVIKAAAFGVPLPLCSCGVIPVAASLRQHGASRGATTAFLISTPQTGVDSILVTFSLLGGVFAIFRPIAALISGILGGTLVAVTDVQGEQERGAKPQAGNQGETRPSILIRMREAWVYGFVTLPRDIGKALLLGLVVAALISATVQPGALAEALGGTLGSFGMILLMMLVGIPIYVCATASVPIAAALIHMGVSPGAAFAFLVTGPATNAATISTVWKVMGRRTAVLYLATMAASAIAGGLLLDRFVKGSDIMHVHEMGWMMPEIVKTVAAAAMLAVLGYALVGPYLRRPAKAAESQEEQDMKEPCQLTFQVTGMTCSHCAGSVRRAILECPGVRSAEVDLQRGLASVRGETLDFARMRQAIEGIGYGVREPAPKESRK